MEDRAGSRFYFLGNHLSIDFANTLISDGTRPVDLLGGMDDYVGWLVEARVIDGARARDFLSRWNGRPETEAAFQEALKFRGVLKQLLERISGGRAVPSKSIEAINGLLRLQSGYAELKREKGGYEKRFHSSLEQPLHLILPVAESACDLLAYGQFSLIKKCENSACVLYYYDTTKNHGRRWCSMSGCGNRAKAAAHYLRKKLETQAN
jgi:predicted RNA-binding Zn ribbon-like protein